MDTKNKVLHVCNLDKFIPPFIEFLEEHFDDFATRHIFFIAGDIVRYPYHARANIVQAQRGRMSQVLHLARLAAAMQKADKIILHGLFNKYVVILLFLMPWLLQKCYWVMWGGDLYVYQLGNRYSKSWKLKEFFRRPVIRRMGYLVTGTPGDVELARKWYDARGQHIRCFNYPSNIFEPSTCLEDKKHSGINILVGNSADPSNNHKEVLDRLRQYKDINIKIFCPLSYGNKEYANKVMDYGKSIFGNKFIPITEFLKGDEYNEFLQTIDSAIFNHTRQQAFGNILKLLGYGKKVFIRKESTLNGVLECYGIVIFDSTSIDIKKLNPKLADRNTKIVTNNFSKKTLAESLNMWIN